MLKVHYQDECMSLRIHCITAVGKLYSVEGTLPEGVYVTATTVYYCCR